MIDSNGITPTPSVTSRLRWLDTLIAIFLSISTILESYQDDGRVIVKDFEDEPGLQIKMSPAAGGEPEATRSAN